MCFNAFTWAIVEIIASEEGFAISLLSSVQSTLANFEHNRYMHLCLASRRRVRYYIKSERHD